ncbi:hypothetical protein, partial [Candidatus Clavichlamydia salmonicola]|uniref:hypothetical protein n=1 Tax=Candidatus Clavichlamydia salmonicola TaxID=469812 RepID=UPI001891A08A
IYTVFSKINPETIKITDKEHLLTILNQGVHENKLYFKKHHPKQLLHNVTHNPIRLLDEAIEIVKKNASSSKPLPIIKKPTILEEVYQAAITIKKISKKDLVTTTSQEVKKKTKLHKTCLFSVKLTNSRANHHISSFKICYTTHVGSKKKFHHLRAIRYALTLSMSHMINLCNEDLSKNKIQYIKPFTNEEIIITKKDTLYQIFYEGINENMTFLSEEEPYLRIDEPKNILHQTYQQLLNLLKNKLGKNIPQLPPTSILQKMTDQEKAASNNEDDDNSSPSLTSHKEKSLKVTKPDIDLSIIQQNDKSTCYLLPGFSIKKYPNARLSKYNYHISYITKYHFNLYRHQRNSYNLLKKLVTNATLTLQAPEDQILFLPYGPLKQKEIQLENKEDIFKILHKGLLQNYFYYKKYHPSITENKKNKKLLNSLQKLIHDIEIHALKLSLTLPPTIDASFLENMLKDIHSQPEIIQTKKRQPRRTFTIL